MTSAQTAVKALRALGPAPLARYARYQIGLRSGWYRWRSPLSSWHEQQKILSHLEVADLLAGNPDGLGLIFFFEPFGELSPLLKDTAGSRAEQLLREADGILEGRFSFYGSEAIAVGNPVDWGRYPMIAGAASGESLRLDRHWTRYEIGSLPADIKLFWELSRFGWVYTLVRAYRLSAAAKYFDGFVELLQSWRAANQPNAGPQWISAQECALRVMAIGFAAFGFAPDLARRPEIRATLAEMLLVHAKRIELTLDYAEAQGNNHLLVEALGLYTVGLILPQFADAERWRSKGRNLILKSLDHQIFPDGGYIQHSVNYQRLALQAGLWATRLADVLDDPLPAKSQQSLKRLAASFGALVDPENGRFPNFGPNDGANILPLSTLPFADARPTVQAAAVLLFGQPELPSGPWDEMSIWFGMAGRLTRPQRAGEEMGEFGSGQDFPHEGIYKGEGAGSRAFFRSAHFETRPGHSDQLNVDIWRNGINIVLDAGSYLYQGAPPWQNPLSFASAHNAVLLDGSEPMTRAGRFLWLDWVQAGLLGRWRSPNAGIEVIAARHNGYESEGVQYQRSLVRAENIWLVVDELFGHGDHSINLHWLLADGEYELTASRLAVKGAGGNYSVQVDGPDLSYAVIHKGQLVAGEAPKLDLTTMGWHSPTYASLRPAISLLTTTFGPLPLRISSLISFEDENSDRLLVDWRVPAPGRIGFASLTLGDERLDF